jgi:hypothetical protein
MQQPGALHMLNQTQTDTTLCNRSQLEHFMAGAV